MRSAEAEKLVDEYHAKYKAALLKLWNDNKNKYAPNRKRELAIVE